MANPDRVDVGALPARDDTDVRETNGQAPIAQRMAGITTFDEAQRKARKWADRGLELNQSGYTARACRAERCAAAWLARMVHIEAGLVAEPPPPKAAGLLARKAARTERRPDISDAARNITLRAWRR